MDTNSVNIKRGTEQRAVAEMLVRWTKRYGLSKRDAVQLSHNIDTYDRDDACEENHQQLARIFSKAGF